VTGERVVAAVVTGGAGMSWLALVAAHEAPYARYLGHGELGDGGASPLGLAVFLGGWSLMIIATLVPTTLPLLDAIGRVAGRRHAALGATTAGFVAVWAAFGYVAWVGDTVVHAAVAALPWLAERPQAILTATLAGAGAYQFSPLKRRCLAGCRSPRALVLQHWGSAGAPWRRALRIGAEHGRACLGCCWPMMLVMFAIGLGSLAWMLVLAAAMALEKRAPFGDVLTRPLGVALLGAGAAVGLS
jgi:predicted metal-binding membrane protein